jgi:hypothetical protein
MNASQALFQTKSLIGICETMLFLLVLRLLKIQNMPVSVVVEHGGSGSKVAAPIAQKLLKMALERDRQPSKTKTARANAFNKTVKTKVDKA